MLCPRCGRENPASAKFCGYCGAAPGMAGRPGGMPTGGRAAGSRLPLAIAALVLVIAGSTVAMIALRRGGHGGQPVPGSGVIAAYPQGSSPVAPGAAVPPGTNPGPGMTAGSQQPGGPTGAPAASNVPGQNLVAGGQGTPGNAGAVQVGQPGALPAGPPVTGGMAGPNPNGPPVQAGQPGTGPGGPPVQAGQPGGAPAGPPVQSAPPRANPPAAPVQSGWPRSAPQAPPVQSAPPRAMPPSPPVQNTPPRQAPPPVARQAPRPQLPPDLTLVKRYLLELATMGQWNDLAEQQIATLGGNMLGDAFGLQDLIGNLDIGAASGKFQRIMRCYLQIAQRREQIFRQFKNNVGGIPPRCPRVRQLDAYVCVYFDGWVQGARSFPIAMQRLDLGTAMAGGQQLERAQRAYDNANRERQALNSWVRMYDPNWRDP